MYKNDVLIREIIKFFSLNLKEKMRKKGGRLSVIANLVWCGGGGMEVMGKSMELKHFTLVLTSCPNISVLLNITARIVNLPY